MEDLERLLVLNIVEGLGSIRTQALLRNFGSLDKIFQLKEKEFAKIKEIGPKIAPKIVRSIKETDIKEELGLIKKHGVKVMTFLDENYPKNLKNIYAPPVVLYVKGEIMPQDDVAIAIVGSRLASFYGIQTAERFGFELGSRGITIISGLARGIDSSAHKGALKAKARTLAILGSGIARIYPEEHKLLAQRISESGALISEFPMMRMPDRGNFPRRNRIISGLSIGVVVVEAAEKSGALITSDIAMEEGRDVFAVPGKIDSVTSKGTHKLIKQGAKLAECADDILEELDLQIRSNLKEPRRNIYPILDKEEAMVYTLLSSEPRHIDELSEGSGIGVANISRILLNLEIKKFTRQLPGKNFVKL
jgi:DNA processing protein